MNKKCVGCGSLLQSKYPDKDGYINEELINDAKYCKRCFKIKNYGEYTVITEKIEFDKIIKDINNTESLVVFLVDILNINQDAIKFLKKFKNEKLIVITKRDVIPKSVKDNKIINYFNENFYRTDNIICVSSYKNKNIDEFLNKIRSLNYKKVYIVGLTNSGKSTFINAILKSIGKEPIITTSALPNTTINYIEIKINEDITIIDTPGFVLENSIYNYISFNEVKKITPTKELKVKTYQIKPEETIFVDGLFRIDYLSKHKNSFSFYMNNNLNFNRMKIKTRDTLKALPKKNLHLNPNEDIVINGLGFIKVIKECDVVIYTLDESLISTRKSMI